MSTAQRAKPVVPWTATRRGIYRIGLCGVRRFSSFTPLIRLGYVRRLQKNHVKGDGRDMADCDASPRARNTRRASRVREWARRARMQLQQTCVTGRLANGMWTPSAECGMWSSDALWTGLPPPSAVAASALCLTRFAVRKEASQEARGAGSEWLLRRSRSCEER